ncbi:uncharacterized protein CLUP02_02424 [Colletotrichum lupini]|uniref:Uncharacterized protein n=1 Tax=Colletotrichum lupini TaxID=145971 RepID=A0A9Q8WAT6_9PEZI|nr:uncharacterized protein CLUP02_02424 [Colletotrichum lupini]UQC76958.1 hypothetical protein CLUP02_02424 [Colletotrichum lupini]
MHRDMGMWDTTAWDIRYISRPGSLVLQDGRAIAGQPFPDFTVPLRMGNFLGSSAPPTMGEEGLLWVLQIGVDIKEEERIPGICISHLSSTAVNALNSDLVERDRFIYQERGTKISGTPFNEKETKTKHKETRGITSVLHIICAFQTACRYMYAPEKPK